MGCHTWFVERIEDDTDLRKNIRAFVDIEPGMYERLDHLTIDDLQQEYCMSVTTHKWLKGHGVCKKVPEFHDVFRVKNYPEDILKSLDQTVNFIEANECEVFDDTHDRLKEFWDKYPNGLIYFS
jgi:hypothetical protein